MDRMLGNHPANPKVYTPVDQASMAEPITVDNDSTSAGGILNAPSALSGATAGNSINASGALINMVASASSHFGIDAVEFLISIVMFQTVKRLVDSCRPSVRKCALMPHNRRLMMIKSDGSSKFHRVLDSAPDVSLHNAQLFSKSQDIHDTHKR